VSRRALLSSEQRARLFGIPVDQAEMARHYLLSPEDLVLVRAKRRAANRLGFAIQLCALRYPGRALEPLEAPPASMLSFVAKQIGVDPALFGDYARRGETRREHLIEVQKLLEVRSFGLADWRACLRVGADAAWATDRGEPIVQAMLDQTGRRHGGIRRGGSRQDRGAIGRRDSGPVREARGGSRSKRRPHSRYRRTPKSPCCD